MKLGKFIGQRDLQLENHEVKLVTARGFNTTTPNTFTRPVFNEPVTIKLQNGDTLTGLTRYTLRIIKQIGWKHKTLEELQQPATPYDAISYSVYIETDATIRPKYAKNAYRYQPKTHYIYNTDLGELLDEIENAIKEV